MDPHDNGHDPLAANRAANPRRAPGREPVGMATTRRLGAVMVAILSAATVVLAWAITSAR